MRFEEVLPALREGKQVRRASWKGEAPIENLYVVREGEQLLLQMQDIDGSRARRRVNVTGFELFADDWEVLP